MIFFFFLIFHTVVKTLRSTTTNPLHITKISKPTTPPVPLLKCLPLPVSRVNTRSTQAKQPPQPSPPSIKGSTTLGTRVRGLANVLEVGEEVYMNSNAINYSGTIIKIDAETNFVDVSWVNKFFPLFVTIYHS